MGFTMRRRILVADDSRTQQALIDLALRGGGFDPILISTGTAAAAELLREDGPSLAILDWQMPGLTGVEIARLVRARASRRHVYIVVLTADGHPSRLVEALQAGADDFAVKPCTPTELVARAHVGDRIVRLHEELALKVAELEAEKRNVLQLEGLLPMCMHCHRVRNGVSDWQKMERYIESRSSAKVSHGLCDTCLETHYPDSPECPPTRRVG